MSILRGYLDQYGKPLLVLDVLIGNWWIRDTFRIDTGFDRELAVPEDVVKKLRTIIPQRIRLRLPTGERAEFPLFRTKVKVGGHVLNTEAVVIKTRPGLVGVGLLRRIARVLLLDFDDCEVKVWVREVFSESDEVGGNRSQNVSESCNH